MSQDVVFDASSTSDAGGKAIILVGLRVATEPTQIGLFKFLDRTVHPTYEVELRQMSLDGRFARLRRTVTICDSMRGLLNGALSDCTPEQVRYKVLSIPPGRYTVESIAYQVDRMRIITTFNARAGRGLFSYLTSVGDPVRDPGRSFAVDGGSITYIGDLTFYFDPTSAAAGMVLERDDVAARDALGLYPNLHGTPVFRPATGSAGPAAVFRPAPSSAGPAAIPTGLAPIE